MRGQPSPNAGSPRWRSVWITAGILGTAFASWFAWEQYACRHARACLAACAQAATAGTRPDDEKLRSLVVAFGAGDWQHLIREAGRGETKLEGWIDNNRNRLPIAVPPPGAACRAPCPLECSEQSLAPDFRRLGPAPYPPAPCTEGGSAQNPTIAGRSLRQVPQDQASTPDLSTPRRDQGSVHG